MRISNAFEVSKQKFEKLKLADKDNFFIRTQAPSPRAIDTEANKYEASQYQEKIIGDHYFIVLYWINIHYTLY